MKVSKWKHLRPSGLSIQGPIFHDCVVVVEAELITIPGCQYAPSLTFHHQTGCTNVTEHTLGAKLAPGTQRSGLPGHSPGSGQLVRLFLEYSLVNFY